MNTARSALRRRLPALAALAVLGGALLPASGASAHVPCGSPRPVKTFTVTLEWKAKSYAVGEKAAAFVTVSRPGEDAPSQIPRQPASDVNVTVSFSARNGAYNSRAGVTDENGEATVKIPIERYHGAGWASGRAFAYLTHGQTVGSNDCAQVEEQGDASQAKAFKITR